MAKPLSQGLLVLAALVAATRPAWADFTLPYSTRTHQYSAWGTTVQGDLSTLGMAGAEVGLADSRVGSVDNPAGVPLTLDSTGFQVTGNGVQDGYLQSYAAMNNMTATVITYCPYPWGASFASFSPVVEGDIYQVGGQGEMLQVQTREYHFSFANVFLSDKLSLGLSLIVGENDQSFTQLAGGTLSRAAWGFGADLGALYVLPARFLLGLSYTPPIHYAMNAQGDINPLIKNYFQDASSPYRLDLGIGWLPNRFFKASAGIYIYGGTDNTALLSDDSRLIGVNMTFQPRFGLSYELVEFKNLTVDLAMGTYLEVLREQDDFSRLHGTMALEIKPWIFDVGWGLDEARFYQNFIVSFGLELSRVLRKLGFIPPRPDYPYGGILPSPGHMSDQGLSHALDRNWVQRPDGAIEVGLALPGKIRDRVMSAPEDVKGIVPDFIDTITHLPGDISGASMDLWRKTMGVEPRVEGPKLLPETPLLPADIQLPPARAFSPENRFLPETH